MVTGYTYEVWKGKKQVGSYHSAFPIMGKFLVVPTKPIFKQRHGKQYYEEIVAPMTTRIVYHNGVDMLIRMIVDVSKKSPRQIKIVLGGKK